MSDIGKHEVDLLEGVVHSYTHQNRISVTVDLRCLTDFAARTIQAASVAHEVALQACAMGCVGLLGQERVRATIYPDERTIGDAINALSRSLGEPVRLERVVRVARGEPEQSYRAGDDRAWVPVTMVRGEDGMVLVDVQGVGVVIQGVDSVEVISMARDALALSMGCEPGGIGLHILPIIEG